MPTTMLQLVQQATSEMGLQSPMYVAGNPAQDTIQQLALLNAVGYELYSQYTWQAMTGQNIFTCSTATFTADTTEGSNILTNVSDVTGIDNTFQITGPGLNQACYVTGVPSGNTVSISQVTTSNNVGGTYTLGKVKYPMPSDYDRQIDRTHWDKSKHWEMLGPETAQQWEWLISGYISTGPRIRYRIFGDYFQIWPQVTTNEVLGFEYISKAWARDVDGNPINSLTADTDYTVFRPRLMVLGLKLKYFEIKGFDTTALYRDYRRELDIAMANDSGSATLSLAPKVSSVLIGYENIPDSGYGT